MHSYTIYIIAYNIYTYIAAGDTNGVNNKRRIATQVTILDHIAPGL